MPPPEVAGALRPPVLPWEPGTQAAVPGSALARAVRTAGLTASPPLAPQRQEKTSDRPSMLEVEKRVRAPRRPAARAPDLEPGWAAAATPARSLAPGV